MPSAKGRVALFQATNSKIKVFADDQSKLDENGRMLVTSNNSFSHSVFKRLVLQTNKNKGPYSQTILKDNLCLLLQDFCKFECNTTSDWLIRMVKPI